MSAPSSWSPYPDPAARGGWGLSAACAGWGCAAGIAVGQTDGCVVIYDGKTAALWHVSLATVAARSSSPRRPRARLLGWAAPCDPCDLVWAGL